MSKVYRTYVIEGMTLAEARVALERALGVSFEERDSSWYASLYYRCRIDKDHTLKLTSNQDFEGEPIEDRVPMSNQLLEANGVTAEDDLLTRLDGLPFLAQFE